MPAQPTPTPFPNPLPVQCTDCGGADWGTLAGIVGTVAGVLVGAVALFVAWRALSATQKQTKLAQQQLEMASREHREFMKQITARARFLLILDTVGADSDGVLRSAGDAGQVRVRIGIRNEGEKASGPTVVNALVPQRTRDFKWCLENGADRPDVPHLIDVTSETLKDDQGREFESTFLAREIPRVSLRTSTVLYFRMAFTLGSTGRATIPVRVRIESDDMPDDQADLVADHLVVIEQPT